MIRKINFDLVHAVEESVFMALILKYWLKKPYFYDMDSSLSSQMCEKYAWLKVGMPVFQRLEAAAIRNALAVIPVCDALKEQAEKYKAKKIVVLQDVPILGERCQTQKMENVREKYGIKDLMVMYVGNLEFYQGISLLLKGFAMQMRTVANLSLVLIGGDLPDITKYEEEARLLEIREHVHFLGSRPADELQGYLVQADILVSPRIKGENTPMKVYSYMASGKPIVATRLPTHTQVLDSEIAELVPPTPEGIEKGLSELAGNPSKRVNIGMAAKKTVEKKYSYDAFQQKLVDLYRWTESQLMGMPVSAPLEKDDSRVNVLSRH